jgi:1-aminocyclopropane-1-carboxylate deaminase
LVSALKYDETPVLEVKWEIAERAGIRLLVKREDLNHSFISGNKWWKLKYNLDEAVLQKNDTLLTFGGAFSNHVYATAAAAKEVGLKCIGVIRGEETLPLNPTLSFAKRQGMKLHFVSRQEYKRKGADGFIEQLGTQFGNFYLIPEGGTNELAVKGCAELGGKLFKEISFDYLYLPVGTGGTMAGIISGMKGQKQIVGISVLKTGEFLKTEIENLQKTRSTQYENWRLLTSYHHGGYAKVTAELTDFIDEIWRDHHLPLDHVYTAKLFWALKEEINRGSFERGSTVLALHTGGLQGSKINF